MRIVEGFAQNSPEWLAYRRTGIGASDAPALMNESPYGTPFSLWAEKTGLLKREEPNVYALQAMERGKKLEPVARELFEKKIGAKFPAINVLHDEHDFIKASLDGWSDKLGQFVEFKCPSKVEHAASLKGKLTPKYRAQICQQFLITNAADAYFVSYYPEFDKADPTKDMAIVKIVPDAAYQQKLLAALIDMWKRVETKTPPPVGPEDLERVLKGLLPIYERMSGALEALKLFSEALSAQAEGKALSSKTAAKT